MFLLSIDDGWARDQVECTTPEQTLRTLVNMFQAADKRFDQLVSCEMSYAKTPNGWPKEIRVTYQTVSHSHYTISCIRP